jgi:hypothetical protein
MRSRVKALRTRCVCGRDETVLPSPTHGGHGLGGGTHADPRRRASRQPQEAVPVPNSLILVQGDTGKASDEEYYAKAKRRSPYRSFSISSSPLAPPPFLVHG